MVNLYPPYIESKLPAQVGDTLRIPYKLNRATGADELKGQKIHARIKTVSTNSLKGELETEFMDNGKNGLYEAIFSVPASLVLEIG